MPSFTPAQTGFSRVFLIEGSARPDHNPSYQSCLKAGAPSQGFGDVEKIECPDPAEWGKWIEVGRVRKASERAKLPLTGRYAADVRSELLRLAQKGCSVDLHINLGACDPPNQIDSFTKKIIATDALLTNWSADDLGSLASSEAKGIDEKTDTSIGNLWEILPLALARKADDLVTNEIVAVAICDSIACGACGQESDGCSKIYALTKGAGGSAGTPADLLFSLDKGKTWFAHDIDSWASAVDGADLACIGKYVVVIATSATDPMAYALKSELTGILDETWSDSISGFVVAGTPRAIWSFSIGAFIVGSAGYIYRADDPTDGVTVQDAGVATAQNLLAVSGLDDSFAVAVGTNGAIVQTKDGVIWSLVTPTNINFIATNLQTVAVISRTHWQIGTSGGRAYYTLDGGVTFYEMAFPGSGAGQVTNIEYSNPSVGYMAHQTAATKGRVLRTTTGGNSWVVLPEGTSSFPAVDKIDQIAACPSDPNFFVAVGLDDNGSDGMLILGQA